MWRTSDMEAAVPLTIQFWLDIQFFWYPVLSTQGMQCRLARIAVWGGWGRETLCVEEAGPFTILAYGPAPTLDTSATFKKRLKTHLFHCVMWVVLATKHICIRIMALHKFYHCTVLYRYWNVLDSNFFKSGLNWIAEYLLHSELFFFCFSVCYE